MDGFLYFHIQWTKDGLQYITQSFLHSIHKIFPLLKVHGHKGEDSISTKKIIKGKAYWESHKEILGWNFDGVE